MLSSDLVRPTCKVLQSLDGLSDMEVLRLDEQNTGIDGLYASELVRISFNEICESAKEPALFGRQNRSPGGFECFAGSADGCINVIACGGRQSSNSGARRGIFHLDALIVTRWSELIVDE